MISTAAQWQLCEHKNPAVANDVKPLAPGSQPQVFASRRVTKPCDIGMWRLLLSMSDWHTNPIDRLHKMVN